VTELKTVTLAVPVNERDHVLGPANAPVTVVNYADYECPDCQKRHRVIDKMARELLDKVRLIHRHFPLVKVHPHSLRAAEAAEAAEKPLIVFCWALAAAAMAIKVRVRIFFIFTGLSVIV